MEKITKKKKTLEGNVANDKTINDYINDPYFIKKREITIAFLKDAGLPQSYSI